MVCWKHFHRQKFEYLSPILLSSPSVYKKNIPTSCWIKHCNQEKEIGLVIILYTQVKCWFQRLHLNHPVLGTWLSWCKRSMVVIMVWSLLPIQRYLCPEAAILYTPRGVESWANTCVLVMWGLTDVTQPSTITDRGALNLVFYTRACILNVYQSI